MKNISLLCIGLFLVLYPQAIFSSPKFRATANNQTELNEILEKCADYCKKLDNATLFFVCKESIAEHVINKKTAFYVYDYQLIKKGGIKKEKRTLIEENRIKKNEENAPLKNILFLHENLVLGPATLLHKTQQPYFNYKVEKESNLKGLKAIILKATPRSSQKMDFPFGKIWIDKKDFSILKIEWDPSSLGNYKRLLGRALRYEPRLKIFTEYYFEKNGIRFPSKHSVREEYVSAKGNFLASKTIVEYKNYEFFIVETDVKYKNDNRIN